MFIHIHVPNNLMICVYKSGFEANVRMYGKGLGSGK